MKSSDEDLTASFNPECYAEQVDALLDAGVHPTETFTGEELRMIAQTWHRPGQQNSDEYKQRWQEAEAEEEAEKKRRKQARESGESPPF